MHEPPEQALDFADFLRFLGHPWAAHVGRTGNIAMGWCPPGAVLLISSHVSQSVMVDEFELGTPRIF